MLNSCQQGLIGFGIFSVLIVIISQVTIQRMKRRQLKEKPNQEPSDLLKTKPEKKQGQ